MMFEDHGVMPAETSRLTIPQLAVILGKGDKKSQKLSLAQVRAMGLLR